MPVFVFLIVKTYSLYFFANLDIAFKIDRENRKIFVQPTKTYENAEITVRCGEKVLLKTVCTLKPGICAEFVIKDMPEYVMVSATAGGEHAIADQYLFAHPVTGRRELANGNTEKALEVFRKGQILPQSLGAGIWNHCKLVPLKYFEDLSLKKLGNKAEVNEIFHYIATIGIEYFSNMHLKELPYYQARAWQHLGEEIKAQRLITEYRRKRSKAHIPAKAAAPVRVILIVLPER